MAFWYKNSNGMGFIPEDGEAEIIEDESEADKK